MPDGVNGGDEARALRLLMAARPTMDTARSVVDHCGLFKSTYVISGRVKSEARLKEKIEQKIAEGDAAYCLENVKDIVGLRFITLYREDISLVVRSIFSLLTGKHPVNPNPFLGLRPTEFRLYLSNSLPEGDPLNAELANIYHEVYDGSPPVKFEVYPRERYSSVHILLEIPYNGEHGNFNVPVEIQARSVFEDAWGEIDHKLLYELNRRGRESDRSQRDVIAQHMSVLKKMMDAAAEYADVIRRTIVSSQQMSVSIPRNLDGANYAAEVFKKIGAPPNITEEIIDILSQKTALDLSIESGQDGVSTQSYIAIAERLRDYISKLDLIIDPSTGFLLDKTRQGQEVVLYLARMEEALCRFLSDDSQQIRLAANLYRGITKDFDRYPNGWFRLGQALAQLAANEPSILAEAGDAARESFDAYETASERMKALEQLSSTEHDLLISPGQESYIRENLGRLQGFILWRMSDRRRIETGTVTKVDLKEVIQAFWITQRAFEASQPGSVRGKLANNATFYAVDAITLAEKLGLKPRDLPTKSHLKTALEVVEESLAGAEDIDILRWDTVAHARLYLGDLDGAREAATEILDKSASGADASRGKASAYVVEAYRRAVQFAWSIVRPSIKTG